MIKVPNAANGALEGCHDGKKKTPHFSPGTRRVPKEIPDLSFILRGEVDPIIYLGSRLGR